MTHLPAKAGVGFKSEHFADIIANPPDIGFFEIHAENYMGAGGPALRQLEKLREEYAISLHGVGLSIGSAGPLNADHLARLRKLIDRFAPESFSEHLAWSSHDVDYLNDLLPLPYNAESLKIVCDHIDQVQDTLGCKMLLENPSTYVLFEQSDISETDFLREIAQRTGCGLLLDVNNVFVSTTNHRQSAPAYIDAFPLDKVGEIHLGAHAVEELPSGPLLIDDHGGPVADPVWALYAHVIERIGPVASLVEWDNDIPAFSVLMQDAARASEILMKEAGHAATG